MGGDAMAQWTLYAMSIFSAVLIGMNGYLVIDFGLSLLPEENWSKAVVAVLFVVYIVALAVITLTWQRRVCVRGRKGEGGGNWSCDRPGAGVPAPAGQLRALTAC